MLSSFQDPPTKYNCYPRVYLNQTNIYKQFRVYEVGDAMREALPPPTRLIESSVFVLFCYVMSFHPLPAKEILVKLFMLALASVMSELCTQCLPMPSSRSRALAAEQLSDDVVIFSRSLHNNTVHSSMFSLKPQRLGEAWVVKHSTLTFQYPLPPRHHD